MADDPKAISLLQPGQLIKPIMDEDTARHLVRKLYGLTVTSVLELNSYDDKNYKVSVEPEHTNPHIQELCRSGYVLKVLNSMDTPRMHVDAEHEVQKLLLSAGIRCQQPVLDLEGRDKSRQRLYSQVSEEEHGSGPSNQEGCGSEHMVRLLTFLEGDMIFKVPYTPELLVEGGAYIAQVQKVLKGFHHPGLTNHQTIWNLGSTPKLSEFLYAVKDQSRRELVTEVIRAFQSNVLTKTDKFQKGVIHGDYNEQNILVTSKESLNSASEGPVYEVNGLLDFGDMMESYYVYEAGMTIMYLSVDSKMVDPLLVGGYVLAGYLSQMALNEVEWSVLKECACARYCQSLVLGAYSLSLDPSNDYVVVTSKTGWDQLRKMWNAPKEWLYSQWQTIIRERNPDLQLPDLGDII